MTASEDDHTINNQTLSEKDNAEFGRREFVAGSIALGAACASPELAIAGNTAEVDIGLKFAFGALVTLDPPKELGTHDGKRKRFIPINGGKVEGPRLNGAVLPGGGDWQEIGTDGVTNIHARYFLEAKDGTVIGVDNAGVRVATPEIIARLTAGEDLDPSLYYFRTATRFEVPSGVHEWMRRKIFICQGVRHPDNVELRFFEVT